MSVEICGKLQQFIFNEALSDKNMRKY